MCSLIVGMLMIDRNPSLRSAVRAPTVRATAADSRASNCAHCAAFGQLFNELIARKDPQGRHALC
jgi:hypothetical protein